MLRLAGVRRGDVVYDLGSGDGRIPIAAAVRYGVRSVGVEIDAARVREARENARRAGVSKLARFVQQDLFDARIGEATVVTLYLLPALNLDLRAKLLAELRPGSRVVSHCFDMGDWKPAKVVGGATCNIYLWVVPTRD
jgi:ribosomal protein L11 methylase PrmA